MRVDKKLNDKITRIVIMIIVLGKSVLAVTHDYHYILSVIIIFITANVDVRVYICDNSYSQGNRMIGLNYRPVRSGYCC